MRVRVRVVLWGWKGPLAAEVYRGTELDCFFLLTASPTCVPASDAIAPDEESPKRGVRGGASRVVLGGEGGVQSEHRLGGATGQPRGARHLRGR